MGNLRDGGYVLVGVDDTNLPAMLPGLASAELASWLDYDTIADRINRYADPPLRFEWHRIDLPNGNPVVVLEVFDFEDIPHICAKAYTDVLREGALNVRPLRKPATTEVADGTQMRAVLQLATEKAPRDYLRTARNAGADLSGDGPTAGESGSSNDAAFAEQQRKAWG